MIVVVSGISIPFTIPEAEAFAGAAKLLGMRDNGARGWHIAKKSLDARKKNDIRFVYSIAAELPDDFRVPERAGISVRKQHTFEIKPSAKPPEIPPVVVGFGPAGIFAGLVLARSGMRPIILEKGDDVDARAERVENFWKTTGKLDTESNVQFGEGGAGAFSDGKLTTRINDPLCGFVLEVLHSHGAPDEILYQAKPHIGTDKLREIIKSIRGEIISLGGEVRFRTALTGINIKNGRVCGIETSRGSIPAESIILAPGHSARDLFHVLQKSGVTMSSKPFSVGVRIEHLQSEIEKALYGSIAGHPLLPRGEYQLSHRHGERAVYTFCMCPGGVVVPAASEDGALTTNGMSFHARDGKNANSALVVSVGEKDFGSGPLDGVYFQQKLERAAFEMGGGGFSAPAQTLGLFMQGKAGFSPRSVEPSYLRGVSPGDFTEIFPDFICDMLRDGARIFDGKIKGFANADAVLTGVEARTSSPVRVMRGEDLQAIGIKGLYPCGEGAGYAGGIISAAVDGIHCASALKASP